MQGIVGYAKNHAQSQIEKCVNLMARHEAVAVLDTFKDEKAEFGLIALKFEDKCEFIANGGGGGTLRFCI